MGSSPSEVIFEVLHHFLQSGFRFGDEFGADGRGEELFQRLDMDGDLGHFSLCFGGELKDFLAAVRGCWGLEKEALADVGLNSFRQGCRGNCKAAGDFGLGCLIPSADDGGKELEGCPADSGGLEFWLKVRRLQFVKGGH